MKKLSGLILGGSVLVAAAIFLIRQPTMNAQLESLYLQNANYHLRVALFAAYPTEQADIVMLGNSLTEWVDWNELLKRTNIANRGIAGDVTGGYLHRLDQVYRLKPKLCFVEGGINDLYANVPVHVVFENYKKIVNGIRSQNIIPIIQSTLFVSPKWRDAAEKNKEVVELNSSLATFANENGIEFVNLNARMSANNMLRDELTYDGVHLTAAGYTTWGEEVLKVIRNYGM